MCSICDGFTPEEVLGRCAALIRQVGFMLQLVGDRDRPDEPGWLYTVGLLDTAGHPELVAAGVPLGRSAELLHRLATGVLDGVRLEVDDRLEFDGETARIGAVHPVQYRLDTFATWHDLAAEGVLHDEPLTALQVLVPRSWMLGRPPQPVLANPWARVDVAPPAPSTRAPARTRRRR